MADILQLKRSPLAARRENVTRGRPSYAISRPRFSAKLRDSLQYAQVDFSKDENSRGKQEYRQFLSELEDEDDKISANILDWDEKTLYNQFINEEYGVWNYLESHLTLSSSLSDGVERNKMEALLDELRDSFRHLDVELKKDVLVRSMCAAANTTKEIFVDYQSNLVPELSKSVLLFDAVCKKQEADAATKEDDLQIAYEDLAVTFRWYSIYKSTPLTQAYVQSNKKRILVQLHEAYMKHAKLCADFEQNINALGICVPISHRILLPWNLTSLSSSSRSGRRKITPLAYGF